MKGIDADDARRKREDNIIELRKNKRDENLQKKRMIFATGGVEDSSRSLEDSNRNTQKVGFHKHSKGRQASWQAIRSPLASS